MLNNKQKADIISLSPSRCKNMEGRGEHIGYELVKDDSQPNNTSYTPVYPFDEGFVRVTAHHPLLFCLVVPPCHGCSE